MEAATGQLLRRNTPSNPIVLSKRPNIINEKVRRLHSLHVGQIVEERKKLGSYRSFPAVELSSRCFHPGKPEGELLSTSWLV